MENAFSDARAILSATTARWLELVDKIPPALLARPAAPGEWSALDCLGHLLDTEQWVFPARVRAFLAGEDFASFDPDAQGTKRDEVPGRDAAPGAETYRSLAEEFARLRADSLSLLESLSVSDLSRTAVHSELGRVTLAEMVNEWAGHDLMHTVQAERALMQQFIASCGPWRPYFADHDLGARP